MWAPRNSWRALAAAAVFVTVAALVKCSGPSPQAPIAAVTTPAAAVAAPAVLAVETPLEVKKATAKKTAALKPKPKVRKKVAKKRQTKQQKQRKLRADVAPKDFVVSGVSVSERGYQAKIDGWVRMTRKGALAQPLLSFDLTDGDGNLIHRGTFTPMDSTGPLWRGFDELGLKRVAFSTTVDLRAAGGVLPAVPPRPYAASVRVAEVIDAKPATR